MLCGGGVWDSFACPSLSAIHSNTEPNLVAVTDHTENQLYHVCLLPSSQRTGFIESGRAFCVFGGCGGGIHTHTLVSLKVTVISVSECVPNSHISGFPGVLDKMQILGPSPTSIESVSGMATWILNNLSNETFKLKLEKLFSERQVPMRDQKKLCSLYSPHTCLFSPCLFGHILCWQLKVIKEAPDSWVELFCEQRK